MGSGTQEFRRIRLGKCRANRHNSGGLRPDLPENRGRILFLNWKLISGCGDRGRRDRRDAHRRLWKGSWNNRRSLGSPTHELVAHSAGRATTLAPARTRLNTGDSFKSKTDVDNKRHTNAHQPLTSHSPTGITIPPLRHNDIVNK